MSEQQHARELDGGYGQLRFGLCPNCGRYHVLGDAVEVAMRAAAAEVEGRLQVDITQIDFEKLYGPARDVAWSRPPGDDYVAGQLLVFSRRDDAAALSVLDDIGRERILDARLEDSLDAMLARHDLVKREEIDFNVHLVTVPPGEEARMRAEIEGAYSRSSGIARERLIEDGAIRFAAIRNPVFNATALAAPGVTYQASDFYFTGFHQVYKALIGADGILDAHGDVCIAILDSGVADDVPFAVEQQKCFIRGMDPYATQDDFGHGTAIALIIHDVLPEARIRVYKVMDADGKVEGYSLLAPLTAETGVHVANLSFARRPVNPAADPETQVVQWVIGKCLEGNTAPILTAATGNDAADSFAFPARYGEVVAVGAVNSRLELSPSSSVGALDCDGHPHEHFYVMPGGERGSESLGGFSAPVERQATGTSFATAYASAAVAYCWAQMGVGYATRDEVLAALPGRAHALGMYSYQMHGYGLLRF